MFLYNIYTHVYTDIIMLYYILKHTCMGKDEDEFCLHTYISVYLLLCTKSQILFPGIFLILESGVFYHLLKLL